MTLILGTLYVLGLIDATASGYSAAAGRNALIDKRAYYRKAMIRGFFLGQIAAALSLTVVVLTLGLSKEPALVRAEIELIGARMLQVYLPYAVIIFAALAVRMIPSVDVRSLTSTLIFGPLAGLRIWVALAGLVWALRDIHRELPIAVALTVIVLWLWVERAVGLFYRSPEAV